MSAPIKEGAAFESVPQQLFQTSIKVSQSYPYAVTPDGGRFLINVTVEASNPAPMTIVLNWTNDLKL